MDYDSLIDRIANYIIEDLSSNNKDQTIIDIIKTNNMDIVMDVCEKLKEYKYKRFNAIYVLIPNEWNDKFAKKYNKLIIQC